MTGSPEPQEPPTISLLSLADRFIEDHKRMPNRAFAFVLGAGASRSSGIKGASQMVEDWIRSLHREATGEVDGDGKAWANAKTLGIKSYDPADPAACYSELYHKMYARDPDRGYAYLEEQMQESEPSYGYSVLARIMEITQHRVVVTTNFDNLVADALSIFGKTYPLVCGHESLAGFISARIRRPLVVKVHRDLLLAPKSTPKDLNDLPEGFRAALTKLFGHYTPIVIGYGGNDGSLMGFLKELPKRSVPGGVYWCYWEGGGPPPADIRQFVAAQNGCLVPIPGFDEAMLLLGDALEFDVPDKFVLERAEARAKRIIEQVQALNALMEANKRRPVTIRIAKEDSAEMPKESATVPDSKHGYGDATSAAEPTEVDVLSTAVKKTMQRKKGALRWWQWQEKAGAAVNDDERDRIYREAISALPDAHELLFNYANFLRTVRKDHDKAGEYYLRALAADPVDADYLGNYALFLADICKKYDKAEAYFIRALAADPDHANNLGNYAWFLKNIRKEYDKAEAHFIRALAADPSHANNLGNYAVFLADIRKDYEKAEAYFTRALAADPVDVSSLVNYAVFLVEIRKNYDKAEAHFTRALAADPVYVNGLVNYAFFLTDIRKDYDKAEVDYNRALEVDPVDAKNLVKYAFFLTDIRKDYDKAEAHFIRALAADPVHASNLGSYSVFLTDVRKDYDKAEEHFIRALAADPVDANNLGNYARLLLVIGRNDEGLAMLDRALTVPDADLPPPLALELRMYEVCHRLPEAWLTALTKLKMLLLTDKITTGDWDFSGVIEAAKRRGHPADEWLNPLAAVCAGTSDASVLDGWDAWKTA